MAVIDLTRPFNEELEAAIADKLSISRPTLRRWLDGTTEPHESIKIAALQSFGYAMPLREDESLDPDSEDYVGRIRARALGAKCTCVSGNNGVYRDIMCPYHGR